VDTERSSVEEGGEAKVRPSLKNDGLAGSLAGTERIQPIGY